MLPPPTGPTGGGPTGSGLLLVPESFSCNLVRIPDPDLTGDCSNLELYVFLRLAKRPILDFVLGEADEALFSKWTRFEESSLLRISLVELINI